TADRAAKLGPATANRLAKSLAATTDGRSAATDLDVASVAATTAAAAAIATGRFRATDARLRADQHGCSADTGRTRGRGQPSIEHRAVAGDGRGDGAPGRRSSAGGDIAIARAGTLATAHQQVRGNAGGG